MQVILPILIFSAVCVLPVIWLISNYNRFANVQQHLRESWANIEVEMKRRYELIPNLVGVVKGYAKHEQSVLESITKLRNNAMANRGSATDQAVDETALQIGLKQLFAVVENYPDLKADVQFLSLQQELANTEDRIAASRRFFNGNVRELNQLCDQFPSNIVGNLFGFVKSNYFELSNDAERVVPRISL